MIQVVETILLDLYAILCVKAAPIVHTPTNILSLFTHHFSLLVLVCSSSNELFSNLLLTVYHLDSIQNKSGCFFFSLDLYHNTAKNRAIANPLSKDE